MGDDENILAVRGREELKGWIGRARQTFRAVKPLCMIWYGGHTSLHICANPQNGSEPSVSHGL